MPAVTAGPPPATVEAAVRGDLVWAKIYGFPWWPSVVRDASAVGDAERPRLRVVFLDCSTEALVRRYESSRRPHPSQADTGLSDAIEAERERMEPVKAIADLVLDTSDLSVHDLRDRVGGLYGQADDRPMRTTITSFGYKHGLPRDVDLVFDCRFLPNPHWIPELRPLSGMDGPVREHVLSHEVTQEFLDHLEDLLAMLMPAYVAEGKSYLSVALGCTGGRHRSVWGARHIADWIADQGHPLEITHRELNAKQRNY